MDPRLLLDTVVGWVTTAGLRLLLALALLFILFRIIDLIARRVERASARRQLDKTLARAFSSTLRIGLKGVVILTLIGFLGIDTGGLAALVTSLGVGLGLAVNGALANLAGGVLIILTRPFRVDDFIEDGEYAGTVEEIRITYTVLRTPDNRTVYLPNGELSNSKVINYSRKRTRRIDLSFRLARSVEPSVARAVIGEVCAAHELVLPKPAPTVQVAAHSESATELLVRVWVGSDDYFTVQFDLLEEIKAALDSHGLELPFPQMDVHVKQD